MNDKRISLSSIIGWFFGIVFFLNGMAMFIMNARDEGVLIMLASLLLIPNIQKLVSSKIKIDFTLGIKVILFVLIFLIMDFGYQSVATQRFLAKSSGKVVENITKDTDGKIASDSEIVKEKECPDIIHTASYEFNWGESISGNRNLYLYADFIKQFTFSDDWGLDNLPMTNSFSRDTFYCEKGATAGESLNKLYCRPTYMYTPILKKNTINQNGDIISTDYRYIKTFIFNIAGKDINNNVDLRNLDFEGITCSRSS